jgi:hypothetical protein
MVTLIVRLEVLQALIHTSNLLDSDMPNLTKQQVKDILQKAPANLDKREIVDGLVKRGYVLEGFNDGGQATQSKGTWGKISALKDTGIGKTLMSINPLNTAIGEVKGFGSTLLGAAKLGSSALKAGYDATIGKLTGKKAIDTTQSLESVKKSYLTPTNAGQSLGFGAEQVGEFFTPGGAVSKGSKAVELVTGASKLPTVLKGVTKLLSRAAMEGAGQAGVTALQGGSSKDVAQNAALGAGGSIAGNILGSVGKKLSPVLKSSAEKSYSQALGATTKENKAIASKIVPGLIEKGQWALSRDALKSGFEKKIETTGKVMDSVLEGIPKDSPVNLANVVDSLETAKQSFMVPGAGGKMVIADPQAVKHIEGFQSILKDIGTTDAPYESVRKLRQIWDKGVAQSKGFYGKTLTEGSLIDAQKTASDALRGELAKQYPNMDKVNKEYSFWSNANKVLSDTLQRTQSQGRPLTETLRRTAGAVAGTAVGGATGGILGDIAMSGLTKLVDSTAWKTVSALQKNSLAKYLATGDIAKAMDLITKIAASQNKK